MVLQNCLRYKTSVVTKLNFNLLKNTCSWMVVLYGQLKHIALVTSLEKFHGYRSIHKNHKIFLLQTICNIQYHWVSQVMLENQTNHEIGQKITTC